MVWRVKDRNLWGTDHPGELEPPTEFCPCLSACINEMGIKLQACKKAKRVMGIHTEPSPDAQHTVGTPWAVSADHIQKWSLLLPLPVFQACNPHTPTATRSPSKPSCRSARLPALFRPSLLAGSPLFPFRELFEDTSLG